MTHDVHRWFRDLALPLWVEVGWDPERHCFLEQLNLRGSPVREVPHRTMVQCRQIYVMVVATKRRWHPLAEERALLAAKTLFSRFADVGPDGGFVFAVDRGFEVVDARHDLYTHAFVLFACAALAELTSDAAFLDRADRTLRFLDAREATSSARGDAGSVLPRRGPRRQDPHMHLLEALLALHERDPTRSYLERAETICDLMERHFLLQPDDVLIEDFDEDWRPLGAPDYSFEPGHHFEWVWLLDRVRRLGGSNREHLVRRLWSTAVSHGVGETFDVFDTASVSGNATRRSLRLWPQTEAARAALLGRSDEGWSLSNAIMDGIAERFLFQDSGVWVDRLGEAGQRVSTTAPASSLYHLCTAIDAREDSRASQNRA